MKRLLAFALVFGALPAAVPAQNTVAIVNGASFLAGFPVAPGSLASAFGEFTGVAQGQAEALPLPVTINNVQVVIDGAPAPLVFVSPGQINFQMPRATPAGNVPARVTVGGNNVATGMVDVLPTGPGLFILDPAEATQPGAVLNQDSSVNGQAERAQRGSVIQIFATGAGINLSGEAEDGAPPTELITTTEVPRVYVSVREAEVLFSGLSPQFPGVWQINVRVPTDDFITGQVPVMVEIGGILSNPAGIWVED
jgi:uncharacterized protein (TIGR03437 family)